MSKFFRNVSFYLLIIVVAIWVIDYYSATTVAKIGPRVGTASKIPAKIANGTVYFKPSNK